MWRRFSKSYFQVYCSKSGTIKGAFYGDSISIGYTEALRCALEGEADVFRLFRNGGSSWQFVQNMEIQRKAMFQPYLESGWEFEWDLIHFNVGLHDLKYVTDGRLDKINGQQVSSIIDYKKNLNEICEYLHSSYPSAKLVFAATTPVPEGEPRQNLEMNLNTMMPPGRYWKHTRK